MVAVFFVLMMLLSLAALVFTIWAAIEIATKPFVNDKDKVLWLIIVLLLGGIGPLIYLTQRKKLLARYQPVDDYERLDLNQEMPVRSTRGNAVNDDYV